MLMLALNTTAPIFSLIALGWFARYKGWLRPGDEKVLNSYVYHFALPALFLGDLSQMRIHEQSLDFIMAGILPIPLALAMFLAGFLIFKFSRDLLNLLILSTVFGSLAFFGIPFLNFAFPGQAEHLAALSAASISAVGVAISLLVLELHQAPQSSLKVKTLAVLERLGKNPLILSIGLGFLFSFLELRIPLPIFRPLHMLGSTTVTVAIFLLGVFLYGRNYTNLWKAFQLSLLRVILLPCLGLFCCRVLGLNNMERIVVVLMQGMPIAIAMIVLSERYNFHRETIASLVLISSLGSPIYLTLWVWLLRFF